MKEISSTQKLCSFYVSNMHFATMILPFVNKQIKEKTSVVTFLENNLLSTGGQNLDNNIQDYITIINNNNENKININGFIKKEAINKSNSEANVDIIINSKKM